MTRAFLIDDAAQPRRQETDVEQQSRVAREEAVIAKARADIAAGFGIEDEDVEAWLDSLEQDANAPLPSPRRATVSR